MRTFHKQFFRKFIKMPWAAQLLIIFFMLALNAIFAAYEMALASISRAKITVLVNQKRTGAVDTAFMKDHIEASLAVIQVGITLAGAIAAATGGAGIVPSLAPWLTSAWNVPELFAPTLALIFFILPLSALTIIFSELIPKTFALNNKVSVCLSLSPIMRTLFHITHPVIRIFEGTVKGVMQFFYRQGALKSRREENTGWHELIAAASLARASRLIGASEEKIVLSAAQLSIRPIREAMIPINDVFTIPLESRLSDALVRAHLDMHTRFPVCAKEGDPQSIQGYINFKDIVMALKLNPTDPTIKGILRPIKFLPEGMMLATAMEQMIREKLHIAMVQAGDNQTIGMITLEDIIEELVGQIEDEFDRMPSHVHPYEAGWIMGGGLLITTVSQITGKELWPEKPGETPPRLSDWFSQQVGGELTGGEMFEFQGLQFTVRKLRRKKLSEVIITHKNPPQ